MTTNRFEPNLDNLRENALDLIESGIPLIRLYGINPDGTCGCNGICEKKKDGILVDSAGKHPQGAKWQKVEQPTTENKESWIEKTSDKIEEWFDQGEVHSGLGAVLPEDIVIIDVDCKDGKKGLESLKKLEKDSGINIREMCGYVVNSGSGKPSAHYWFRKDPEVKVRKTLREYPDIDFLHSGNYVVIEGSMHARGNVYERDLGKHEPKAMTQLPAALVNIIKMTAPKLSDINYEAGALPIEDMIPPLDYILDEYQGSVPYEDWFRICMAMHFETGGSQEGYEAFDEWSSRGNNYSGATDTYKKWLEGNKPSSKHITGATIIHMAQELGWKRDFQVAVDMSEFLDSLNKTPKTVIKNNDGEVMEFAEFPDELKSMNGIVGILLDWSLKNSMKPSLQISLAAVIHEVSVIIGRDFRTNIGNGNYSNIMSLVLADTCQGKDQVKTLSSKVSSALKQTYPNEIKTSMGEVTSVGAIISEYETGARKGAIIDEFGHWLASASSQTDNNKKEVVSAYMQLATSAHSNYIPKAYSQATLKAEDRKELRIIERPFMSLVGMTTPQKMAESGSDIMIKDGFLGRFLTWFPTEGDMPIKFFDSTPLPAKFAEWVEMVHISIALANKNERGETVSYKNLDRDNFEKPLNPVVLDIKQVEPIWREFERELMDKKVEYKEFGWDALLGRSLEMSMRMALIFQVSENPTSKVVSEDSMRKGIALIKFLSDCREKFLKLHFYSNKVEKQVKEIYNIIHSKKTKGITMEAILNMKPLNGMVKSEREDRLNTLYENGSVILEIKSTGKGRPSNKNKVLYSTEYKVFEE